MAPRLIYVSQTPTNVNVDFTEMPTEAHVVFVNITSTAPSPSAAVGAGGAGSAARYRSKAA